MVLIWLLTPLWKKKNMQKDYKLIAFLAFAMYFLTGAACIVLGSSLPHLIKLYNIELSKVVLLGSSYAFGRVLTVYTTGRLVEKFGPMKVLMIGVFLISCFLVGIPLTANYYMGLFFAFLGGVGMGAQDTVCPVLLSIAYSKNYASSLSAGQALFGLGNFMTPFLIGVFLIKNLPFYFSYYILLIVPLVMLVCIFFVKATTLKCAEVKQESVQPIYVKNKILTVVSIIAITAAYSAIVNTLGLYISSFAQYIGVSESSSAFMLTIYNIGAVIGSFVFIIILKKIKVQSVFLLNNIIVFFIISLALFINRSTVYFINLFIAGFFLGVLFSVIVTIATRIGYKHISRASSLVAVAGGISDILTPIVTGLLVKATGITVSFYYVLFMIAICIVSIILLMLVTTENSQPIT